MRQAQGSYPAIQERGASEPVTSRMQGSEGKVEGQSPIREDGEVRERVPCVCAPSVGTIPTEYVKNGRKGIEREKCACDKQDGRGKQPRRREPVGRVEGAMAGGGRRVPDGHNGDVQM